MSRPRPPQGPVLIDLEGAAADDAPGPDRAPPVPEPDLPEPDLTGPQGRAMHAAMAYAGRPGGGLGRWFLGVALALLGLVASVAAWDFATGLVARVPVLGWLVAGLLAVLVLLALALALREWAGFQRLSRLDALQNRAATALADDNLALARDVTGRLRGLYAGRDAMRWAEARFDERASEQFDAAALLSLAETELLAPLDAAAMAEVEQAARQVAMVTALVPLALADVVAALVANLRMIRRVAELYGGRAGVLGSWRLMRAVMAHILATGAVALGDDMISSVAGGGVLSRLSRRFGEGLVNGALTARVGIAAIEVCRPLPFVARRRPTVSGTVKRALAGLFGGAG